MNRSHSTIMALSTYIIALTKSCVYRNSTCLRYMYTSFNWITCDVPRHWRRWPHQKAMLALNKTFQWSSAATTLTWKSQFWPMWMRGRGPWTPRWACMLTWHMFPAPTELLLQKKNMNLLWHARDYLSTVNISVLNWHIIFEVARK